MLSLTDRFALILLILSSALIGALYVVRVLALWDLRFYGMRWVTFSSVVVWLIFLFGVVLFLIG